MRFGVAEVCSPMKPVWVLHRTLMHWQKVKHPCDQGFIAMMGVFIDTFIILTLTAVVVLVTDVLPMGYSGVLNDSNLTQAAFSSFFGSFGNIFIAICMFFFAFSTIIGWYFFGASMSVLYLVKLA